MSLRWCGRYNVHAFFALKKRFHFSCESPLGKATPGCNAGSSRLFDPQYYDDKVSETDVQGVVDSLYPHNTVTWLHPNCCAQYQRVAEPQVRLLNLPEPRGSVRLGRRRADDTSTRTYTRHGQCAVRAASSEVGWAACTMAHTRLLM